MERLSKNLLMNLFITVSIGILGFAVNSYFAKYMGSEMLGLMKLFTQLIAYLNLVELGIGSASTYSLYKPLADNDIDKINIIISTIDSFYKKIAFFILSIGFMISIFINDFVNLSTQANRLYLCWILYVINTSLSYFYAKYIILFSANQEYGYVRKIQGMGRIIFQIIQIWTLILLKSFECFIFILLLENLYNYYFYKKHYEKKYSYIKKVFHREKKIFEDMKNLFWHKIGGLVVHNTDYIILSKYLSLSVIGLYSSYLMINQIITTLINVITPVITPWIGSFIAQNNEENEKIYLHWKKIQIIYLYLITIFVVCVYIIATPFVKLWLGNEFILSNTTLKLILLNLYISLYSIPIYIFKFNYGFFEDTYTPILESILNLSISILLVKKLGLNGVILGTLVSNFIVLFLLKPILVFKKCFKKKFYYYLKDMIIFVLLTIVSLVFVQKMQLFFGIDFSNISNWIELVQKSLIFFSLTTVTIFLIFLSNKSFREFIVLIKLGRKFFC